ncbi:hypothetical protein [Bradyrhizobium sp. INPA03-11B]|uniref:hypothetical protein n=1 Tax=Bradyrhizobium sp. INPA03-11B TaxID=418598 RepID=UPI00338EB39F
MRQIAQRAAIFGARTLSLASGAAGGAGFRRAARTGAFARTGQFVLASKEFGRRRADDAQATGWEDVAS